MSQPMTAGIISGVSMALAVAILLVIIAAVYI
jgi:hypothetical protein